MTRNHQNPCLIQRGKSLPPPKPLDPGLTQGPLTEPFPQFRDGFRGHFPQEMEGYVPVEGLDPPQILALKGGSSGSLPTIHALAILLGQGYPQKDTFFCHGCTMTKNPPESQSHFLEITREWPTQPGVYIMRDAARRILYVGKAKNLRSRIRSYFLNWDAQTPKTRVLVRKIENIEFTVTDTELDALLLECNLIKKHRPRYNIRLKDDKNYPYVVLDFTHRFPQFRITRRVEISPQLRYFGPYSAGVRDIGRFLLKTFRIRDCSDAKFKNRDRPCLNYEIGTCTGPCVDLVSEDDYAAQVREAILFLEGKTDVLLKRLNQEMEQAAEDLKYEIAGQLRDRISAIERITQKQSAVLTNTHKDIDILGSYEERGQIQWVMLFVRKGFLIGRRTEKISNFIETMDEAVGRFLEQFYSASLIPDEIWVAEDFSERETLQSLLSQKAKKEVRIQLKRNEKGMRLLGMARENAKLIYQDNSRRDPLSASDQLKEALGLADSPHVIEGIDVSNIQGTNPAVALVHFADERPLKSMYRLYYPKTIQGQDDFGMIYETVLRRFSKMEEHPPPDVLLIDGGKGQLNAAKKALDEAGVTVPLCSIAKSRSRSAFTRKEVDKSEERIFIPGRKNHLALKEGTPAMALLQRVRDEAHRFSVKSHRRRRTNEAMGDSVLTEVEGIGEKKKIALLQHFGSIEKIAESTEEELVEAGLNPKTARRLLDHLKDS